MTCQYCNDLDEYDSRHGHKCDDDCIDYCQVCDLQICLDDDDTKNVAGVHLCLDCYSKIEE